MNENDEEKLKEIDDSVDKNYLEFKKCIRGEEEVLDLSEPSK